MYVLKIHKNILYDDEEEENVVEDVDELEVRRKKGEYAPITGSILAFFCFILKIQFLRCRSPPLFNLN